MCESMWVSRKGLSGDHFPCRHPPPLPSSPSFTPAHSPTLLLSPLSHRSLCPPFRHSIPPSVLYPSLPSTRINSSQPLYLDSSLFMDAYPLPHPPPLPNQTSASRHAQAGVARALEADAGDLRPPGLGARHRSRPHQRLVRHGVCGQDHQGEAHLSPALCGSKYIPRLSLNHSVGRNTPLTSL